MSEGRVKKYYLIEELQLHKMKRADYSQQKSIKFLEEKCNSRDREIKNLQKIIDGLEDFLGLAN